MTKIQNTVIIGELKKIAAKNDWLLKPEEVVKAASAESSPLHSRFEWNDGEAAHQYRLGQARNLIRVCVEVIQENAPATEVFVSLSTDRTEESGGYRLISNVLSNKQQREQMLLDAINYLNIFQEKYNQLKELAFVFKEIKNINKKQKALK